MFFGYSRSLSIIPQSSNALSVFFIWESLMKTTYRCRELVLISVSALKYFTLVGTHFIEFALAERALALAGHPRLICSKVAQLDRPCQLKCDS